MEERYSCGLCSRAFSQEQNLREHLPTHEIKKESACDCSNKAFSQEQYLKAHSRTLTCDICKKTFSQLSTLLTHSRTHTNEKPYACDICKKTFSQHPHLMRHLRTHTKEKPHACDIFYAPSWFRINVHHSIKNAVGHLWHFISSSRYFPKKYRDIIEPVFSRNAYLVAPENILLTMLTDERGHIETFVARRIIKAREIG
ncbi:Protein glass [Araneus ventricosus]|uniref:Protein glass n=1 Tax=Araneus ventricosus TaxID=182803 RepID=A0A4Y2HPQ4_ARAVE|nr:Protein glass [Araneus ventricosus]